MIVGSNQKLARDAIVELIASARQHAPPVFAALLDEEATRAKNWRARISVVGQVKAGKSTFLGAFIGRPGFFPADVNPWTSAITNLYFGHPDDPAGRGVFHFFAPDAWSRIIHGDEKARSMVEQLLPGFQKETLAEQVASMQTFARARLGDFYDRLLGERHEYDAVNDDILARYVCAGPEKAEMEPMERIGRYACITERADLFLSDGPFATPAVVTDTPGLNDPFLIRDELTCRSLAHSDVFIVVLSAHQALTDVDLAFVRMLASNPANRVVIFLNRIDELADVDIAAPMIVEEVRRRLGEAMPETHFSVVAGSAFWGEVAAAETLDAKTAEAILSRSDAKAYLLDMPGPTPSAPAALLAKLSGVEEVGRAVSAAIESGPGRSSIERSKSRLIGAIDIVLAVMSIDEQRLQRATKGVGEDPTPGLQASFASLVDDAFARGDVAAKELLQTAAETAREKLATASEATIASQRGAIIDAVRDHTGGGAFKFDFSALREQLEAATAETYQTLRRELDASLDATYGAMARALAVTGGAFMTDDFSGKLPNDAFTTAVPHTNRVLSIALTSGENGDPWSEAGFDVEDAADQIGSLILWETEAAIRFLSQSMAEALSERAAAAFHFCSELSKAAQETLASSQKTDAGAAPGDVDSALAELRRKQAALFASRAALAEGVDSPPTFRSGAA